MNNLTLNAGIILGLLGLGAVLPAETLACSCMPVAHQLKTLETGIAYASEQSGGIRTPDVFRIRILGHRDNSMEVERLDTLSGDETRPRLTFWGDDGASCRPYVGEFEVGSEWVVIADRASPEAGEGVDDYALGACGVNYLPVETAAGRKAIQGAIAPGVSRLTLAEYEAWLAGTIRAIASRLQAADTLTAAATLSCRFESWLGEKTEFGHRFEARLLEREFRIPVRGGKFEEVLAPDFDQVEWHSTPESVRAAIRKLEPGAAISAWDITNLPRYSVDRTVLWRQGAKVAGETYDARGTERISLDPESEETFLTSELTYSILGGTYGVRNHLGCYRDLDVKE